MPLTISTGDLDTFAMVAHEYEESLPLDLRHEDLDLRPDVAFVATDEGVPCGCVAFIIAGSDVRLRHLYVRPTHRNRGVARTLLAAFIEAARSRGACRIILDTDRERLSSAYALYRSLGFVECAPHGFVDYATPTFMELTLDA